MVSKGFDARIHRRDTDDLVHRRRFVAWPAHHEVTNAITDAIHYEREIDRGSPDFQQAFEAAIQQLGQGWVAEEALAISVFCSLVYVDDFEGGVLASVNHSGDSRELDSQPESS